MADLELIRQLSIETQTRIVMLVMDGLGGMPRHPGGPTELEFACTPNLDNLPIADVLTGLERFVAIA